jgi:hypothetical protein
MLFYSTSLKVFANVVVSRLRMMTLGASFILLTLLNCVCVFECVLTLSCKYGS